MNNKSYHQIKVRGGRILYVPTSIPENIVPFVPNADNDTELMKIRFNELSKT